MLLLLVAAAFAAAARRPTSNVALAPPGMGGAEGPGEAPIGWFCVFVRVRARVGVREKE